MLVFDSGATSVVPLGREGYGQLKEDIKGCGQDEGTTKGVEFGGSFQVN